MRKVVVITYFWYYINTHLEGLREGGRGGDLSHDSVFVKI
jgi:hypothetical protein